MEGSKSDSEDDIPILELIKKRKEKAIAAAANAEPAKRAKTENGTKSSKSSSSSSSSSSSARSSSANKSTDFYENTKKGLIIQRLLCRWWYAIDWPKKEDIPEPPPGYEAMEGFPGVFISTSVDSLGKILDLRNPKKCPNLVNLSKVDSAKLQRMCLKAYERQMDILAATEGDDVRLLRTLRSEMREIKSVNPQLADKEAQKYTQHGF